LLKDLVSAVEGATGAILLENEGEAVRSYARDTGERLRLRGAYVALVLKSCRATAVRGNLGTLICLVVQYAGSSFVVHEIDRDCFLMLELSPSANIGQALFRLKPAVESLRAEISKDQMRTTRD
jgi:predicted regulator of Ras-like GTPase activity (Roadblock/LC7/MglB family)